MISRLGGGEWQSRVDAEYRTGGGINEVLDIDRAAAFENV
jgi:hypothetical protein